MAYCVLTGPMRPEPIIYLLNRCMRGEVSARERVQLLRLAAFFFKTKAQSDVTIQGEMDERKVFEWAHWLSRVEVDWK